MVQSLGEVPSLQQIEEESDWYRCLEPDSRKWPLNPLAIIDHANYPDQEYKASRRDLNKRLYKDGWELEVGQVDDYDGPQLNYRLNYGAVFYDDGRVCLYVNRGEEDFESEYAEEVGMSIFPTLIMRSMDFYEEREY